MPLQTKIIGEQIRSETIKPEHLINGFIQSLSEKTQINFQDLILIEDSEDNFYKKKVKLDNIIYFTKENTFNSVFPKENRSIWAINGLYVGISTQNMPVSQIRTIRIGAPPYYYYLTINTFQSLALRGFQLQTSQNGGYILIDDYIYQTLTISSGSAQKTFLYLDGNNNIINIYANSEYSGRRTYLSLNSYTREILLFTNNNNTGIQIKGSLNEIQIYNNFSSGYYLLLGNDYFEIINSKLRMQLNNYSLDINLYNGTSIYIRNYYNAGIYINDEWVGIGNNYNFLEVDYNRICFYLNSGSYFSVQNIFKITSDDIIYFLSGDREFFIKVYYSHYGYVFSFDGINHLTNPVSISRLYIDDYYFYLTAEKPGGIWIGSENYSFLNAGIYIYDRNIDLYNWWYERESLYYFTITINDTNFTGLEYYKGGMNLGSIKVSAAEQSIYLKWRDDDYYIYNIILGYIFKNEIEISIFYGESYINYIRLSRNGDILFKDINLTSPVYLSETNVNTLNSFKEKTSIIGIINEITNLLSQPILDNDITIDNNQKGIVLKDTNGTYWRIRVDSQGALYTESV